MLLSKIRKVAIKACKRFGKKLSCDGGKRPWFKTLPKYAQKRVTTRRLEFGLLLEIASVSTDAQGTLAEIQN